MEGKQIVELTEEQAAELAGKAGRRDMLRRVNSLEYSLTKNRDALRVIARGLEDMAEKHAAPDERQLSGDDVSLIYGAVNLLDCVADDCHRSAMGEAMA